MPVIPVEPANESPLVGAWGMDSHANMDARYEEASATVSIPVVYYQEVNTNIESWAPAICFVHQDECVQTLAFELESMELTGFERKVWIAGELGAQIDLYWEVWDKESGWRTLDSVDSTDVSSTAIDPGNIDIGALFTVRAPSYSDNGNTINPLELPGQLVLYAVRSYRRSSEGNSGPEYRARSNPLLVSLYESGA